MTVPTVGRVLWYRPGNNDPLAAHGAEGPLAAVVARVWNNTCVNLAVFDGNGAAHARTSVYLLQEGYERPAVMSFCEWPPLQRPKG